MTDPESTAAHLAAELLRAAELYAHAIGKPPPPNGLAPVYEAVSELHRIAREYAAARKAGA